MYRTVKFRFKSDKNILMFFKDDIGIGGNIFASKRKVVMVMEGDYWSPTIPSLSITSKRQPEMGGLQGVTLSLESLLLTDQLHCSSLMRFALNRLISVS